MKYVKELENGDIVVHGEQFLNLIAINGSCNISHYISFYNNKFTKSKSQNNSSYREATNEEKHWLLECIKLDRFISKEEALKTFNLEIQYEIC